MNLMPNGEPEVIIKPKTPFIEPKFVILALVLFLSSFVFGLLANDRFIAKKDTQEYPLPSDTQVLLISKELLQNPILSNWSGQVKGRVVDKTDDSFTISQIIEEYAPQGFRIIKDATAAAKLKVTYNPDKTNFKQDPHTSKVQEAAYISFPDLRIGDTVSGGVAIQKPGIKWQVIGRNFFVD